MNLDRISIKVVGREGVFMTLAKISDFSKLYTTFLLDQDLSMQKINTGDSILAFNFKNIEQFKGFRPFKPYNQDELLDLYKTYGTSFMYQTKLHSGDLVRYNGLKYVVLGVVVNTYAQWNMPTPLLFNPTNINNDYKSLYGSKLTESQINDKINDNFQAGKYDVDMVIPLVDMNDFSEQITVLQPRPTKEEIELMFDSIKAEKDLTIKSQKDVFIDTMLRLKGNEINKIKEVNEDLFKGVQNLLLSVNKAVNEQIEMLPQPVIEKPVRKPRAKKVFEEAEPVVEVVSDDLPDFIEKRTPFKNLPEPIKKLVNLRNKQLETFPIKPHQSLDSAFVWSKSPEGNDFWALIKGQGDLREFKKKYGNKGELVDAVILEKQIQAPIIETQEVKYVELIFYPPSGGVLELKTDSIYELYNLSTFLLILLKVKKSKINFKAITDLGSYTTQVEFNKDSTQDDLLSMLVEKYDFFVKPELNWKEFDERQADTEKFRFNQNRLIDALKPEPKPATVEKPKPVVVEKPKPVPVEKPKPVKVEKPKPAPVEKPKPVKVERPKKEKVTKPKVEFVKDDLSFLDDLDNIF
jgi:hypothetical protein